jgi:hypothetical protein
VGSGRGWEEACCKVGFIGVGSANSPVGSASLQQLMLCDFQLLSGSRPIQRCQVCVEVAEERGLPCRERDKLSLEARIGRLTHCILHGAAAATQVNRAVSERDYLQALCKMPLLGLSRCPAQASSSACDLQMERRLRAPAGEQAAMAAQAASQQPDSAVRGIDTPPAVDVATTVASVRGAGALFPGEALSRTSAAR